MARTLAWPTRLWIIAAIAVAARVAATLLLGAGRELGRLESSVIADSLNTGHGFLFEQYGVVYQAWKEPLYIMLLATLTRGPGDHALAILLMQGVFGVGVALGVAWLARRITGDEVGAGWAGMLAATNPFLVYYDTRWIHPLSLDTLGFVAVVGVTLAATERVGWRSTVAAGLVTGMVLWQRATMTAAGALAWAVASLSARRGQAWRVVRHAALWAVAAGLVIAPWLIRNALVVGRMTLTTDTAHILWLGNNPLSNGTYSDVHGVRVIHFADPSLIARLQHTSEAGQYDIFLAEFRRFVTEQPLRFLQLIARRLWAFVWFSPNAGVDYSERQQQLYRSWYVGLLGLGLIGLARFWRGADDAARRRSVIALAAVAGVAAIHALTAINMKHRVPWELLLSMFAPQAWQRSPKRRFSDGALL